MSSLNRKITSNKSKHLLENQLKRLKTFDPSYFIGKSHFEDDNTQNYLVFQQMHRYFNQISGVGSDNHIYSSKTKALSNENIGATATKDYKLNPELSFFGTKTKVEFNESCLKQVTSNHGKIVNIYIVYEISKNINICDYPTLENCLFRAVSLHKNAIIRYKYFGYRTEFDRHGSFLFPGIGLGRNVIIFGVDMSPSLHLTTATTTTTKIDFG